MTGSYREYRDAAAKDLQETGSGISALLSHQLGTSTSLTLDVAVDRYRNRQAASSLTRFLGGARLEHARSNRITISLSYRRGETHAPDNPSTGYYNNRILLEAHKKF
jgi:hypothetical protein